MHRRNASLASDYQLTRSESREKVTVIAGLAAAIALSFASSVIAFQSAVSKFLRLWLSFTERFPAAGISLHALSGLFLFDFLFSQVILLLLFQQCSPLNCLSDLLWCLAVSVLYGSVEPGELCDALKHGILSITVGLRLALIRQVQNRISLFIL